MRELLPTQMGGCLCGSVRFFLTFVPDSYGACHCSMCRKFSGGIELGVQAPADGVIWEKDDTLVTYKSSDWAERGFCSRCGSSLFWRLTAPGPMQGMYSIAAGALDSLKGLKLTTEVYIDHKPDGHAFAGPTKQMTEADILAMVNGDGEA